jgi:DNA-binding beta-propeller fold protein YncE
VIIVKPSAPSSDIRHRGTARLLVLAAMSAAALVFVAWPALHSEQAASTGAAVRAGDVLILGKQGEQPGEFQQPRGIAVLPDGSFVVVDRYARVQHFSVDYQPLSLWSMKDHALGNPKGVCGLPDGNILVCDTHYGRVLKMTPEGVILKTWGEPGKGPGQFVHPLSAAVDAVRKRAYIVEYGDYTDRVHIFDLDGKWLKAFGVCGVNDGELQRPSGVAVDADGFVYVADSCNHRIQKFDGDGRWLKTFGKEGSADGELRYPYDIALGADGLLYVAEFANHRVSVFDRDGNFVRRFGRPGKGQDEFAQPWSLTADSRGRLMVSDTANHRVKIFEIGKIP